MRYHFYPLKEITIYISEDRSKSFIFSPRKYNLSYRYQEMVSKTLNYLRTKQNET